MGGRSVSEPDEITEALHGVRYELGRIVSRLDDLDELAKTEKRRAWWHRGVSLVLVLLVAGLSVVAWRQYDQRTRNCDAIADAFDLYTIALAGFSNEGADRTPQEQDRFDERVELFRAEIQTRLADCR